MVQVVVAINICFLNALLCAGQKSGFQMLMAALSLMSLNNLDNVIGALYLVISGLKVEGKNDMVILTKADQIFSLGIAVPHIIWVIIYSLVFLGGIPIQRPPDFVIAI